MKRGLYDIEVHPGTIREVALLFHEQRCRQIEYKKAAFAGGGADLESPEETLETVFEMLLPGHKGREETRQEKQAQYLRSLQDVDWSEHFQLDPQILKERQEEKKAQEQFGDIAAH